MMETAALITALAAGAFGALAYGYRGQRDQEREQVVYLRRQLETRGGYPGAPQLPAPSPPSSNVAPHPRSQSGQGQ